MDGISFIVERKLNETEQNKLTDIIGSEFKKYEIFVFGRKRLKEKKPMKFLNIKNTKKRTQHALKLCRYDTICIVRNTNILFSKIKAILELLDSNDLIIGEIELEHHNFYTKHLTKQHIGFLLFSKKTLLKKGFLKNYPDFKNLKTGYAEIPLREEIRIPKIFRPLNSIFSFLVYPHVSEKKEIKISIGKDDCLYIPEIHSAKKTLTIENIGFLSVLGIVCIALLGGFWHFFGVNPILIFLFVCSVFYISNWTFKLYLAYNTMTKLPKHSYDLNNVKDSELPIYSILIPLYKEASVLKQIVSVINNLNYPKNKLDVKLLLEEDDLETINAVKKMKLPRYFETVIIPHSFPKGKPKALNIGLTKIKGKYLTIYDAEDIVDRDQLKKVYLVFKNAPDNVGCVHSKLNFYNKNQNWLTKIFTTEYTYWYELCMPWLIKDQYIVPFGGNSVHFKTEVIKKMGGWDPYNVTEDCEIGIRLYRKGYVAEYVNSITTEEAVLTTKAWIRQRSRWMKGYILTSFVNLRHPVRLYKELGLKKILSFFLIILGTPIIHLLNLLFGTLTILWFLTYSPVIKAFFPWYILYPSLISFVFGNFMMIYLGMIGSVNNKYYNLVKWNLLSPLYWLLMAVATVKSVFQLIIAPHFWEKTAHGFHLIEKKETGFLEKTKILKLGSFVKTGILKLAKAYNRLDKHLERKIKNLRKRLAKCFKKFTTNEAMKRLRKWTGK